MSANAADPQWNNQKLTYALAKHNWPRYWLQVTQQLFPQVQSLETVHQLLTAQQISQLSDHCDAHCAQRDFQQKVDAYLSDLLVGRISTDYLVQRYFNVDIVVPNQQCQGKLTGFTQGIWQGQGVGLRSVWTPITDSYNTNTLWVIDTDRSREITMNIHRDHWDFDRIQSECRKSSWPVTLRPGQAHLYQQHHLVGTFNNNTAITHWSMTGAVLPKGGYYHRMWPGSCLRFPSQLEDIRECDAQLCWVGYSNWNTQFSRNLPLSAQKAMISQYCERKQVSVQQHYVENEYLHWLPGLEKHLSDPAVHCVIMPSMYAITDHPFDRKRLLDLAMLTNTQIHFAHENFSIREPEDVHHLQQLLEFVNQNPDPHVHLAYTE